MYVYTDYICKNNNHMAKPMSSMRLDPNIKDKAYEKIERINLRRKRHNRTNLTEVVERLLTQWLKD